MHRPARVSLLVPLALGAVLLGGCGSDVQSAAGGVAVDDAAPPLGSDAGAGSAEAARSEAGGGVLGYDTGPGAAPAGGAGPEPLGRAVVDGAVVVRTAQLAVRVDDLRAAADRAALIAREAGGSVSSERADSAGSSGGHAEAELVLRVPPERFDDVLSGLAALGEERVRTVGTEEVGDQLLDIESRLAAQRASVERVRALLAEARDLAQVVQIESELTRRTADLESLQARLAALQDRVRMSTVTLRLDTEGAPQQAALPGFLDGLRGGWAALLTTATVLGATAGALLPFLPFALLAGVLALRARRRRRAPGPGGPPFPAAPAPPATA